jgi:hypothetical protein
MKLGDMSSSGELPRHRLFIAPRLANIQANHLPEIYLCVLGRVLTYVGNKVSKGSTMTVGGLGSAKDSTESHFSILMMRCLIQSLPVLAQRGISPICCFLPLVEDYDDLLLVGYASNTLPFASIDRGDPS